MDNGVIAELKAASYFASKGYDVFLPHGGKAFCDLVIAKDNDLLRVEVKSTSTQDKSNSWLCQLRQVRSNRTGSVVKMFDSSKSDILVVYIAPEDRIEVLASSDYEGRNAVSFKQGAMPERLNGSVLKTEGA